MRAVGRDEVRFDPAVRSHQPSLRQLGVVVAGIVHKQVDATMAALRAPNFSALRVGVTEGGQVVGEVEHRKLVTPYITNDVEDPKEFPKIQNGLRQIIEHFERMAGIARNNLFSRFASDPGYRELADARLG